MRKNLIHFLVLTLMTVFCATAAVAQNSITGTVVDADNDEPLIGASVVISGTTQGTVTDLDGNFTITTSSSNITLEITYIGYKDLSQKVTRSGNVNLGVIKLQTDALLLRDVIVTSSVAIARKTPVAVSTLDPVFIEENLGTQEFPELLKSTPGVYTIKNGGGYGDSEIMMRGFKSENLAVMINGVPVNDMEWGGVYWSNWAGLSDVTRSMQTQRGLGASKVSGPSVGGSINIVTRSIDAQKGGTISYTMGENGENKILFSVSTGLNDKGWALTLLGGRNWGDGYVQGTEFDGYTYFVNIAKRINDNHQLSFTGFGNSQIHDQRSQYDGLSIQGWQDVAKWMPDGQQYRYNPTYGFGKNGERKTANKNKYHKPQLSLNHIWEINESSSLSTALYVSIGDGWGHRGEYNDSSLSSAWYGASNGTLNTGFRNADGTMAYDKMQDINEQSNSGSKLVLSRNKNQHKWYGLLSTYTKQLNENFNFYAGLDGRYYIGTHTAEITDLMNGDYYMDTRYRVNVSAENNKAAANPDFMYEKLTIGDVVYRDYDGHVLQGGVFGQLEYELDKLNTFVAGSVSNTTQWRYDRFYYDKEHAKSEKVSKIGFTVKGGANYNINEYHNVFGNVGVISRAPFFSGGVFLSAQTSNMVNKDAVNEKIFSFELGYGYRSRMFSANLNLYHTKWIDKTMANSINVEYSDGTMDRGGINMQGVNALHQGIELDFVAKPLNWLDINGMFSIGNWRWINDAVGYFYDSAGQPLGKDADGNFTVASGIGAEDHGSMTLELDGVKVGGSAQTTAALGATVKLNKDIRFGINWNLFARNYADWQLNSSDLLFNSKKTFGSPWMIPSASTVDVNASYKFKIGGLDATLFGNVTNLFNQEYISSAYDGANHDWETAYRVFYGFGRRMSVRLKVSF